MVHAGIVLILIGAIFSDKSIRGKVSVKEGNTFEAFDDAAKRRHSFPSSIKLLEFNEDAFANKVLISQEEYSFSPSHPLRKWGYYFFSYDYDIKWDVKKIIVTDGNGEEYVFEPTQKIRSMGHYSLNHIGLGVNRDKDTLAEFVVLQDETITGALFVGTKGTLAPNYGFDLRLTTTDFDVSYISTIMIAKDPGLFYVFLGFGVCLVGFIIAFLDKQWKR